MTIPVPTPGSPVLDTWGAAVANRLNRMIPIQLTSDQSTNSATAIDLTDLSFPVVSGRSYVCRIHGYYSVNATNQGLLLGLTGPTSTTQRIYAVVNGNASATGKTENNTTGTLTTTPTSTDAASPALRAFWADVYWVAAQDGTVTLQFARGGTTGAPGVTVKAGTGGFVLESA